MKKLVNIRFPFLIAVSLIAGILLGYLFIRINLSLFFIIAIIPYSAIIFILCIIYSKKKLLIYCACALIFFVIGTACSYFKINDFDTKEITNGDTYSITATVCEKGNYDGGEYLIVKNVKADGHKIKGKIKVYLSNSYGEFCDVGYRVNFSAKMYTYDAFPYGKLNYNAVNSVKYQCRVYGDLTSEFRFSLFGTINAAVRHSLYNNLDYNTASVAYAMLTGNSDGIEDGSISAFRYGGIAHIFAVSGLHIGIIYGLLNFLCNKLHIKKIVAFFICFGPVFLYVGVCGFTLSSIRALIMCAVASISKISFAKYDALNSLSVAVIAILLLNPLSLFSVGFQLSVCAVAGIIMLSKSLSRPLKKVPPKIKDSFAVSMSAQAGTLPIMLIKFGYISGAGLVLNIIVVPILSIVFAVLFVSTVISLILPFISQYILPYTVLPLELAISIFTNAGFEKSLISGFGAGAFIPVFYFALLCISDKFNIKLKCRIISIICAVSLLGIYVPLKTFAPFDGYKIIVSAYYGGGEVLIKSRQGNVLVITEELNTNRLDRFLSGYYSSNIDALIIIGGENCANTVGKTELDCNAYVYGNYINVQPFKDKKIIYENNFSINGIEFKFADGYSLIAVCGDKSIGICSGKYIPFDYCDLLITDSFDDCLSSTTVSFNERKFDNCIYNDGDFILKMK